MQDIATATFNGLGNLVSGGTWYQSGADIKSQEFSSQQAEIERQFNAAQAQTAREFSAQEAQKARDWEERMSNTAIARAIADARNAGINPYSVYSGGGASTPSAPMASAVSASAGTGARGSVHSSGDNSLIPATLSFASQMARMNSARRVANNTSDELREIAGLVNLIAKVFIKA